MLSLLLRTESVLSVLVALAFASRAASSNPSIIAPLDSILADQTTIITQTIEEVMELEYGKNASDVAGITDAAVKIKDAYNNLMVNISDPYNRTIVNVTVIRIDEVTIDHRDRRIKRNRKLRGSHRLLSNNRRYVRAVMSVGGTCTLCRSYDKLVNDVHHHRNLNAASGGGGGIPAIGDLIDKQNDLINYSDNDTVDKVSGLLIRAVILAAEANIAADNAEVHEKYVKNLEDEIKRKEEALEVSEEHIKKRWEETENDNSLLLLRNTLNDMLHRIYNERDELETRWRDAKNEEARLRQRADELKSVSSEAESKAVEAEKEAIEKAKKDAEDENRASAIHAASIKEDARLIDATFDDSLDEFTFQSDMFHGTNSPDYSKGNHVSSGDGSLVVKLGGEDESSIQGISGGWEKTFTLAKHATNVEIALDYELVMAKSFEPDEYVDIVAELDGTLFNITSLYGTNDQSNSNTGSKTFAKHLANPSTGTHIIKIGAYLNKKNQSIKIATAAFSNFMLTVDYATSRSINSPSGSVPAPSVVLDDKFDGHTANGYHVKIDAFGYNTKPKYIKSDISGSSKIKLEIGGGDDTHMSNMSAGWYKAFHVPVAGLYKLSIKYRMSLEDYADNGEDGYALLKIDGNQHLIYSLHGDGSEERSVSKEYKIDSVHLGGGNHEIAVGALFTKKTKSDEILVFELDEIKIEPK